MLFTLYLFVNRLKIKVFITFISFFESSKLEIVEISGGTLAYGITTKNDLN